MNVLYNETNVKYKICYRPEIKEGLILKPLFGEPEEVAEALHTYQREGITHVQLNMDQMTTKMIEDFAPVFELLERDS